MLKQPNLCTMSRRLLFGASLLFICNSMLAAPIEWRYDTHTKPVFEKNALGSLQPSLVVATGLDRFVVVKVKAADGTLLSEHRTARVTINDRLTTSTGSTYGKSIPLSFPREGKYSVTYQMLDTLDRVIESAEYNVITDITAPSVGRVTASIPYGRGIANDGLPIWSPIEAREIRVSSISDSNPIIDTYYEIRYREGAKNGDLISTGKLIYNAGEQTAMLGTGSMYSIDYSNFPSEKIGARFTAFVKDEAGNIASTHIDYHNNGHCVSRPQAYAYGVQSGGSVLLGQPNMRLVTNNNLVDKNPVDIIFRVPNDESKKLNPTYGGYPEGHGVAVNYQWLTHDNEFSYLLVKQLPVGTDGHAMWPIIGHTDQFTWRCHPYTLPNATFTSSAIAPVFLRYEALIDNYGWVPNSTGVINTPDIPRDKKLSQLKMFAEPRSYAQDLIDANLGYMCTVPIGGTSCIYRPNWPFNSTGTSGHYHQRPMLTKSGTELRTATSYIFEYDGSSPIIHDAFEWLDSKRILSFTVTELFSGATWGRVKLARAGVRVWSTENQLVAEIDGISETDGDISKVNTSLSGIASGDYRIEAFAVDNSHNTTSKTLLDQVTFDNDPPEIELLVNQIDFIQGQLVKGLESLMIRVIDQNDASVESMTLTGGPASDSVELAFVTQQNGLTSVEYPRLFPSLEAGQEYLMTIVAADKYQNSITKMYRFNYEPNNLIRLESIAYLPVAQELFDSGDVPFARVLSNSLRTDDGSIASGVQSLLVSVRSDSQTGIAINEVQVLPGETKSVQYTITNLEGMLELPIRPITVDSNGDGSATFLVEIPYIK
ncbi:Ig-like domain-containing protein (plasmid) [Vibrio chaetopteri]|uniref:Ig-like domain-containing protein n=1 Tax=Vibrio chaetopteri TaxID=3016528 RepID=UPI003AB71D9E